MSEQENDTEHSHQLPQQVAGDGDSRDDWDVVAAVSEYGELI